jgi:hypothetical protein
MCCCFVVQVVFVIVVALWVAASYEYERLLFTSVEELPVDELFDPERLHPDAD